MPFICLEHRFYQLKDDKGMLRAMGKQSKANISAISPSSVLSFSDLEQPEALLL